MSTKQITKQLLSVLKEHELLELQEYLEVFGVYTVDDVKRLGREKKIFDSFCEVYSLHRFAMHKLLQMCQTLCRRMSAVTTSTTSSKRKASVDVEILEESSIGNDVVDGKEEEAKKRFVGRIVGRCDEEEEDTALDSKVHQKTPRS